MAIKFIGIDPSLSNLGLCSGKLSPSMTSLLPDDIKLIRTYKSKDKIRKSADDYNRCRLLYNGVMDFYNSVQPDVIFTEMPIGSQSASAMKGYGVCIMLMASLPTPLIQVTPAEVKMAATGCRKASKADMIKWASSCWEDLPWMKVKRKGSLVLTNHNEHLADSLGAVAAGLHTADWSKLKNSINLTNV